MVEMELEDVVVRVAGDGDTDQSLELASQHRIVLLRERHGKRVLPIWVGPAEGDSLALHLGSDATPRPLTADLMARLLEAAKARVERVVVSRLHENTFYAVVAVSDGGATKEVDARPSDALNLAARVGAPIYADEGVLQESTLRADDIRAGLDREREKKGEPALAGEWRSLSPELVRAVGVFRSR